MDLQTCSETSCCIIFLWRIQNKPTSTEDYGNPQARETLACQTEEGKVHIHFKYLTEQHHCEMDLSKKTSVAKLYVLRNFRRKRSQKYWQESTHTHTPKRTTSTSVCRLSSFPHIFRSWSALLKWNEKTGKKRLSPTIGTQIIIGLWLLIFQLFATPYRPYSSPYFY